LPCEIVSRLSHADLILQKIGDGWRRREGAELLAIPHCGLLSPRGRVGAEESAERTGGNPQLGRRSTRSS
jgi:hypothetical protein